MSGAEAVGELVTGALVAGAVEGSRAQEAGHASGLCLNCGTGLLGGFCHRCGQPEHIHRSLAALWHDIAHGVLHFEGKVWNTLPLLAWRPGELTQRYVHGERARFVSPMALFLFSVFLMFATFGAIGAHLELPDDEPPTIAARNQARAKMPALEAELKRLRAEETTLRERKDAESQARWQKLDKRIDKVDDDLDDLRGIAQWKPGRFTDVKTSWARLDEGLQKANKNPNLVLYKIQSSAYKYSWALIPLSVPFLWLLYAWHRRFKFYDHAIFVTYSLSFMSLLVITLVLLYEVGVGSNTISLAALCIPPVHMYRQLRGAYGTRRRWALARMMLLVTFSGLILLLFSLLLLTVGALG